MGVNDISLRRRSAGVLLHLTSLPGPHGIGDLGPEARRTADFLASAGQRWWQMLPVGPTGAGNSPYSSPSTFAGNPLLISLEDLLEDGFLEPQDLEAPEFFPAEKVNFVVAAKFKGDRLRKAFAQFTQEKHGALWAEFKVFYRDHSRWVDDYSFFCVLKDKYGQASWSQWPEEARLRQFRRWGQQSLRSFGEAVFYQQFVQFIFHRQWHRLRDYCSQRGIGLIGDVPIFVAYESADVWAHPELFELDEQGKPLVVSGVPPDYFSETGQLWGNPHYRWDVLKKNGYSWWIDRLRSTAERFNAVRLDHFIAFQNYWEIPAAALTAKEGRWVPGPGADFFEKVASHLKDLELIAEDLGTVTPEVMALRDRFDLPGMRVLQFAFGNDRQAESFLPHHYPRRCVAYTGTHDNDTTAGWFNDPGTAPGSRSKEQIEKERHNARVYLSADGREIHWDMIRAVLKSTADTAIIPAQDLLGLGSWARMNRPGIAEGSWQWRLAESALTPELALKLRTATQESGR